MGGGGRGGGGVPGQVEREMGSDLETGAGDLAAGSGPDLTEWLGPLSQTERLEADCLSPPGLGGV